MYLLCLLVDLFTLRICCCYFVYFGCFVIVDLFLLMFVYLVGWFWCVEDRVQVGAVACWNKVYEKGGMVH